MCCETVTARFLSFLWTPQKLPRGYGRFLSSTWKRFVRLRVNWPSPTSPGFTMGSWRAFKKPERSPTPTPLHLFRRRGRKSLQQKTYDLQSDSPRPRAHTRALIRGSQSVLPLFIMSHAGNQTTTFFSLPCHG